MNIVSDEPKLDEESLKLVKSLYDFMKNKFDFSCEPKINFISDAENSKQILCKTGFYDPHEESVNVFITNRHPKDILRSFAHELLHHIQGCEGLMKHHDMSSAKDPNYIMHDDFLKKIEADAFERGNIAFREWEACQKGESMINESKQIEEKKKRNKSKKKKFREKYRLKKSNKIK